MHPNDDALRLLGSEPQAIENDFARSLDLYVITLPHTKQYTGLLRDCEIRVLVEGEGELRLGMRHLCDIDMAYNADADVFAEAERSCGADLLATDRDGVVSAEEKVNLVAHTCIH